jgi:hypothetical protein
MMVEKVAYASRANLQIEFVGGSNRADQKCRASPHATAKPTLFIEARRFLGKSPSLCLASAVKFGAQLIPILPCPTAINPSPNLSRL